MHKQMKPHPHVACGCVACETIIGPAHAGPAGPAPAPLLKQLVLGLRPCTHLYIMHCSQCQSQCSKAQEFTCTNTSQCFEGCLSKAGLRPSFMQKKTCPKSRVEDTIESRTPDNLRHSLRACISKVSIDFSSSKMRLLDRSAD